MMKKYRLIPIALLMALCLVFNTTALGEMEVYINPTNGYQISYPSSWQIVNRETIDAIFTLVKSGIVSGVDGSFITQYAEQIEQMDTVMFITPDFDTPTITYEDVGMSLTPRLFQMIVCPQIITQYKTMFGGLEVLDPGSIITIGDKEFVFQSMATTVMGETMQVDAYYYVHGKVLYSMAFTAGDPNTQEVLASFVPGA